MKLERAVDILGSLAQPTRLMIFRLLVMAAEKGMCAGDIAERLDVPKTGLSFHLKEMVHVGLIESKREGRSIIYTLKKGRVREVITFLTSDCCHGRPELCLPAEIETTDSLVEAERIEPLSKEALSGKKTLNVLFLCTHNSARSQMAEGILRTIGNDKFEVYSAGLSPGTVSKSAVESMAEIGIDISEQCSKSTADFMGQVKIDHAIFLCSDSQAESPRIYPYADQSHQWRIPSPNSLAGKHGSALVDCYRDVREEILRHLNIWLGIND